LGEDLPNQRHIFLALEIITKTPIMNMKKNKMRKHLNWYSEETYRERRTERVDMLSDSDVTQILKLDMEHNIVIKKKTHEFIILRVAMVTITKTIHNSLSLQSLTLCTKNLYTNIYLNVK
jgi:hypothetical protein